MCGAGGTLGRESPREVVLVPRLRVALERLTPDLPPAAFDAAVEELTRDRSAMLPVGANQEVWALLRDGVPVKVANAERGGQKDERVRVVDWNDPAGNDLLLTNQFTVAGVLYTCRPDLVGFTGDEQELLTPWPPDKS